MLLLLAENKTCLSFQVAGSNEGHNYPGLRHGIGRPSKSVAGTVYLVVPCHLLQFGGFTGHQIASRPYIVNTAISYIILTIEPLDYSNCVTSMQDSLWETLLRFVSH